MKLKVTTKGCFYYIDTNEILYVRSAGNGCEVVLEDNEVVKTARRLGDIEGELPNSSFYRVHKSYVVNMKRLTSMDYPANELVVDFSIKIPISRRKKAPFLELMNLLEPGSPLD